MNRGQPAECARHERLIGGIDVGQRERTLSRRDPGSLGNLDDQCGCDAVEVVLASRRPHLSLADHKEVGGVARGHGAGRVEHECLVCSGVRRLDQRDHLVKLRVTVELLIKRVGGRTANCGCEE